MSDDMSDSAPTFPMPRSQISPCPAPDCTVASPIQPGAAEPLIAAGVSGDWVKNARRCIYCGCVYSGPAKIIREWLDSEILGQGWKSTGPLGVCGEST
jgi:hypothetical protein